MTMNDDDQEIALNLKVNHCDAKISKAACGLIQGFDKSEVQNSTKN